MEQKRKINQRTNGPVNAHLKSAILTKYLFKKIALYGAPPANQNIGLRQKSTKLKTFKYLQLVQKKIANFHFSHYKSMETIAIQSSYPTGIKNTNYVEATVRNMYTKYSPTCLKQALY